ncbi:MAG: ferrochelatase, partial [Rhodothermales bacterium]|nr:ferrochelatase [Rhodothermales bacterium]
MSARTGIILLNFGEPESPTPDEVIPFLERIFLNNAPLEGASDDTARRARAAELARRRAPGLIEDYKRIGGSPLNAQAREEAVELERALASTGFDVAVAVGMQFTEPTIGDAVEELLATGSEALVALPMYPLCGFSTNVASLESVQEAITSRGGGVPVKELTAWHHDEAYARLRAENISAFAADRGVDLHDDDTLLYFSAHGTPIKYLEAGSRYDGYVEEHCAKIAALLGGVPYTIGYQNHSNRGIAWTRPDNEEHVRSVSARRLVVEPVSFIHEQSETLAELDIDFRSEVEDLGMDFFRVPVPSDRRRLARVLADLLKPLLTDADPAVAGLHPCRCRERSGTFCTNGHRSVDCLY